MLLIKSLFLNAHFIFDKNSTKTFRMCRLHIYLSELKEKNMIYFQIKICKTIELCII
jgi:hypothetical protein